MEPVGSDELIAGLCWLVELEPENGDLPVLVCMLGSRRRQPGAAFASVSWCSSSLDVACVVVAGAAVARPDHLGAVEAGRSRLGRDRPRAGAFRRPTSSSPTTRCVVRWTPSASPPAVLIPQLHTTCGRDADPGPPAPPPHSTDAPITDSDERDSSTRWSDRWDALPLGHLGARAPKVRDDSVASSTSSMTCWCRSGNAARNCSRGGAELGRKLVDATSSSSSKRRR
jgi:hypothetical protein